MTKIRTLLILGAGSSMPYGFPSGESLCKKLSSFEEMSVFLPFFYKQGFSKAMLKEFCGSLRDSQQYSVDRFLYQRQEFSEIGKFAMALVLMGCEIDSNTYDSIDGQNKFGHWYRYLWNQLSSGNTWDEFKKNSVRIITFNYDRSLEHYLARSLARLEPGRTYEAALKFIQEILPIRHMYGQLGTLGADLDPSTKYINGSRPFENDQDGFIGAIAANGIRTIHERDQDADTLKSISDDMSWAKSVCFLGFSYDEENLNRLALNVLEKRFANGDRASVLGTSKGLSKYEELSVKDRFSYMGDVSEMLLPWDSLAFLRHHGVLTKAS